MNIVVAFLLGYITGIVAALFGWLLAVGGLFFALQDVPVERWWFGAFDWAFGVFEASPAAFTVGFLFAISSATGGAASSGD